MKKNYLQIGIVYYKVIILLQSVINSAEVKEKKKNEVTTHKPPQSRHDMKYILLWEAKGAFKNIFGDGQEGFIQNDCPVSKCYVTSDRFMFGGDLKQFDTILFNGWDKSWVQNKIFPEKRYYHQKYVFVQRESAAKAYICHDRFDYFFNWTMTYKLNSNIVLPHLHIRNINMEVIGPSKYMYWITDMLELDETLSKDLETKTKAVAWFDSKCDPASNSTQYVRHLKKALNKYGLKVDIYGKCSAKHCPKHECDIMLDEDYYFLLALEDSFAEDYITGSILRALRNNVVPIVYGGAKYDKFLPPQSYLDATRQTPGELAANISSLVKDRKRYQEHLRWKSHYSYCSGQGSPSLPTNGKSFCAQSTCELCEALHDSTLFQFHSVYEDFRKWWYPGYEEKCPNLKTKSKENKDKSRKNKTATVERRRNPFNLTEEQLKNLQLFTRRQNIQNFIPGKEYFAGAFPGDIHTISQGIGFAERMANRGFGIPGQESPSMGGGGGGGGGVRTAGELAVEVQRIRVSVLSNNFEID